MSIKCYNVEEAAEIIEVMKEEFETEAEIIIIPPKIDGAVTDEEEIDENDLGEVQVKKFKRNLEILNKFEEKKNNCPDRKRFKKEQKCIPNWIAGDNINHLLVNDNIQPLQERYSCLKEKTPYQLFQLYFDDNIIQLLVEQSHLYAAQNLNYNYNTSHEEMEVFLGVLILSGYFTLPQQHLYWSIDEDVGVPLISNKISKNRFKEMKQYFHVSDNYDLKVNDKLAKLRPLVDLLNKKLKQFGIFEKNLSIDEEMVPYYGHRSEKMYTRSKPIKFGYKLWVLASCSGYPFHFSVYAGKEDNTDLPLSERVVLEMVSHLEKKSQHAIYMGRYFTSTNVVRKLKQEHGLMCTGTVLERRTEGCPLKSLTEMKKEPKGSHTVYNDGDVIVCQWKDNSSVIMATNCNLVEPLGKAQRWSSEEMKHTLIPIPDMFKKYNQYMGGVDLLDRFLSEYRPQIRGKKWWWPLFVNCLNMAVVAAWGLHKSLSGEMSHLDFRRSISRSLLNRLPNKNVRIGQSRTPNASERQVELRHQAIPAESIGRCKYCKKNTKFKCSYCNVRLHVKCFPSFHSS